MAYIIALEQPEAVLSLRVDLKNLLEPEIARCRVFPQGANSRSNVMLSDHLMEGRPAYGTNVKK